MRTRSSSLDTSTRNPAWRMGFSPTSPAGSGGAGSDADSTDLEVTPPRSLGSLRDRCQSTDSPASSRSWKPFDSVRNLFRKSPGITPPPLVETFFLWGALPEAVRYSASTFLTVDDVLNLALVSREVYMFARSDIMWRPIFISRFAGPGGVLLTLATEDFFNEYCERLIDPAPGDCVEVAWEGTFNLMNDDHVTTYEGRAWWSASIVERDADRYKIHYPQWDASVWDEWVLRHRIRWPSKPQDLKAVIRKGDIVEHKCVSSHGISPWLEAFVSDVRGDLYRLADVIVSDPKRPVARDTLRLIHRPRGRLFGRFRIGTPTSEGESRCAVM